MVDSKDTPDTEVDDKAGWLVSAVGLGDERLVLEVDQVKLVFPGKPEEQQRVSQADNNVFFDRAAVLERPKKVGGVQLELVKEAVGFAWVGHGLDDFGDGGIQVAVEALELEELVLGEVPEDQEDPVVLDGCISGRKTLLTIH